MQSLLITIFSLPFFFFFLPLKKIQCRDREGVLSPVPYLQAFLPSLIKNDSREGKRKVLIFASRSRVQPPLNPFSDGFRRSFCTPQPRRAVCIRKYCLPPREKHNALEEIGSKGIEKILHGGLCPSHAGCRRYSHQFALLRWRREKWRCDAEQFGGIYKGFWGWGWIWGLAFGCSRTGDGQHGAGRGWRGRGMKRNSRGLLTSIPGSGKRGEEKRGRRFAWCSFKNRD